MSIDTQDDWEKAWDEASDEIGLLFPNAHLPNQAVATTLSG